MFQLRLQIKNGIEKMQPNFEKYSQGNEIF